MCPSGVMQATKCFSVYAANERLANWVEASSIKREPAYTPRITLTPEDLKMY